MRRAPALLLAAVGCLTLAACSLFEGAPLDHAEVRVVNETGFDLDSVRVVFARGLSYEPDHRYERLQFGHVPRGGRTAYRPLDGTAVYDFSYASVRGIDGLPFATLLSPLFRPGLPDSLISVGPGRYTYRLRLELVEGTYLAPARAASTVPEAPAGQVEVRVRNASDRPFSAAAVLFPGGPDHDGTRVDYGALAPGATSAYVAVPFSYRYAPAEVVVGGETLTAGVIDYTGEAPLAPGRYTFDLAVFEDSGFVDRTSLVREGDR